MLWKGRSAVGYVSKRKLHGLVCSLDIVRLSVPKHSYAAFVLCYPRRAYRSFWKISRVLYSRGWSFFIMTQMPLDHHEMDSRRAAKLLTIVTADETGQPENCERSRKYLTAAKRPTPERASVWRRQCYTVLVLLCVSSLFSGRAGKPRVGICAGRRKHATRDELYYFCE